MQFKFYSDLDFQNDAVNSVINIFRSQKLIKNEFQMIPEDAIVPNIMLINNTQIMENLTEIQRSNKIPVSKNISGKNFSIEMETGTGKTYVYLKTIFELSKQYGLKKFIIVVPSVAIREGVLKTLNITKNHFRNIYGNIPYNYYQYDSRKINKIRDFARSQTIEIMVITIDSFNKDHAVMQQERDRLRGKKPIELVRKTNPILILDEAQNMETPLAKKSLENLHPLFTLRYSATHRKRYNLVYSLNPVDAYNRQLVKKIEISSITKNDHNRPFIRCNEIIATSRGIKTQLTLEKKIGARFKQKSIIVKHGDDLSVKSHNKKYSGFVINEINDRQKFIKFTNGIKIKQGESKGDDYEEIMKIQIDQAIREHFFKYNALKKKGIKPISLFFIDHVDNYKSKNGFIRIAFEKSFNKHKKQHADFKNLRANQVHSGYFSTKKTDKSIQKDNVAFDLIMKNKERLMSFDEPVSFVFSHSALREGWDNPNVFNICTLNQTYSEIKKRQEIGRGMRLPVDNAGKRIVDEEHVLTVIANESYEDYVSKLQKEYQDEYGDKFVGITPSDARKRTTLTMKKGYELNPEFKEIWSKISKKTKYCVEIDSNKLIKDCIKEINKISVDKIKIKIQKVSLSLKSNEGIQTQFIGEGSEKLNHCFPIPNVIEQISTETNLTRTTIVKILLRIKNLNLIFNDPQEFISSCIIIIQKKLSDMLVNGIKYIHVDEWYEMKLLNGIKTYKGMIVPANKTIYSEGAVVDSQIESEFAKALDNMNNVKLFIKLPRQFIVPTPIGEYSPDWAVVIDNTDQFGNAHERMYFVAETKGSTDLDQLRDIEKRKINCAKKHFESLGIKYKAVKTATEILN